MTSDTVFRVIYPETKNVSARQIMLWAKDEAENSKLPEPKTMAEAIELLDNSGTITFHKSIEDYLNTPLAYEIWE